MKSKVALQIFRRADVHDDFLAAHRKFIDFWKEKDGPFGLPSDFLDNDPSIPDGELVAVHHLKIPNKSPRLSFNYRLRSDKFLRDKLFYDDSLTSEMRLDAESYRQLTRLLLPELALSFGAYRAQVSRIEYVIDYNDLSWNEWVNRPTTNPGYHRLRADKSIDINGQNNIFTLHPAMLWDEQLCLQALGYGSGEVVRRLRGEAIYCEAVRGGAHIVLSDDIELTYAEYVDLNERFGKMLGLNRG